MHIPICIRLILILEQVGWDWNPELCLNSIPKKLYFEYDPNIDKNEV